MPQRLPLAFLSYATINDTHDRGKLTEFCQRLSAEVQVQTGVEFPIFQDRQAIQWGQAWQERLTESLDRVTFLIPIVTPSFFASKWCRQELERFLARETALGRRDLVLPVYYVECPVLQDAVARRQDPLAEAIARHQMADWRELRFEPFTSPQVGKTLARMAVQIRDTMERIQPMVSLPSPSEASATTPAAARTEPSVPSPAAKTVPPILVVDQMHRGDYVTISAAMRAARPGTRILVRPGLYAEGLKVDKPLEIIGDGRREDIVIQAQGRDVVLFETTLGRIANLTLRQGGGGYGIDIAQGRLELESCDISSQGSACVAIRDGADPRIRHSQIHDGQTTGVLVCRDGQGTLEDNDIFGHAYAGVQIMTGGNPTLHHNRIHDGRAGGVLVLDQGLGTLEDNDIFGNALAGVEVKTEGCPTLRHNRIHGGQQSGVLVNENGLGTLEDNDIFAHALAGVEIKTGGNPTLRHNRIYQNSCWAVVVRDQGGGTFEHNDLRDNALGAWDIAADCAVRVTRRGNVE